MKRKWVFNMKEDCSKGKRRYEARLVALGYEQCSWFGYEKNLCV